MRKLAGLVLVSMLSVGCLSRAQRAAVVEPPDPVVGDLHCAAPRLTLIEALHYDPNAYPVQRCEDLQPL